MGSFEDFLIEDGRDVSKKFTLFRGTRQQQTFDLEVVRNIIVFKMAKKLAPRMNKTIDEVESNMKLREINSMGINGNRFVFKYSLFNRPFTPPKMLELGVNDLLSYTQPEFNHAEIKSKEDEESEEPENQELDCPEGYTLKCVPNDQITDHMLDPNKIDVDVESDTESNEVTNNE